MAVVRGGGAGGRVVVVMGSLSKVGVVVSLASVGGSGRGERGRGRGRGTHCWR